MHISAVSLFLCFVLVSEIILSYRKWKCLWYALVFCEQDERQIQLWWGNWIFVFYCHFTWDCWITLARSWHERWASIERKRDERGAGKININVSAVGVGVDDGTVIIICRKWIYKRHNWMGFMKICILSIILVHFLFYPQKKDAVRG